MHEGVLALQEFHLLAKKTKLVCRQAIFMVLD